MDTLKNGGIVAMGLFGGLFGGGGILSDGPLGGRGSSPAGRILKEIFDDSSSSSSHSPSSSSLFNPFQEDTKKEETRQLINEAKRLVCEGKDIYNRAKESADRASSRAQAATNNYINFCNETSRTLNTKVKPVMQKFDTFKIDTKIEAPHIDSAVHIPSLSSFSGSSFAPMPSTPSILDMILDEYQYEKAKEQRDEAKAYKEEMRAASSELHVIRDKLNNITSYIESEQKQISNLTQKVVNISGQLESAMQCSSFTPEKAKYLKAIQKIALMISEQISTEFISDRLEISSKYKSQAETLSRIDAAIPTTPAIDGQEALNFIRSIGQIIPIET